MRYDQVNAGSYLVWISRMKGVDMKKCVVSIIIGFLLFSVTLHAAKLPEFTGKTVDLWINSKPLKVADLRGNVVLVEIWTST
jgi:hypothetical protein